MKIEIYAKEHCPYCIDAKNAMKQAGYAYTEYTIGKDATKEDVQKRVDSLGLDVKIMTVPQIFIEDAYVGGYTDLVRLYKWAREYNSAKLRGQVAH